MAKSNVEKFNEAFLRTYRKLNAEPQYIVDGKGRKVRVFTADAPCTAELVRFFYLNERAVEEDAALENIGANALAYQIKIGNLVRDDVNPDLLYITTRAAESYKLPKPRVGKFLAN